MKIVVAMNAFKGSLTSKEATSQVALGFKEGYREADVVQMPVADGGDGTAAVLTDALGGRTVTVPATGPNGDTVLAEVGILDFGKTAVIESAKASGLALVPPEKRDIRTARSTGVGELILWASEHGVRRIIVGIGGTAMNDGGIGAIQAAGGFVLDRDGRQVGPGLAGLASVASVSLGSIPERFRGIEVVAACDVVNPMTGPDGSTAVYGPQKGLNPEEVLEVDRHMGEYARVIARDLGRDPTGVAGSGAGGSLGGALWAFFGARIVSGAELVMEETGLLEEMDGADLVITGEGRVDFQTAKGKVPYAVARAAAERGVPALVIGGGLGEDVVQGYPPEFAALFSSMLRPESVSEAMSRAGENLRFCAEQIGRLARVFALSYPVCTDEGAGGIVVRAAGDCALSEAEVLLIFDRYGFAAPPKGHIDPGETREQATVREVFEETGIRASILRDIGSIRYRHPGRDGGGPVQKTVHFFLMEATGGGLTPQPGETLDARWVKVRDLPKLKTYSSTRLLVERALDALVTSLLCE
ncbi:MAG: glycerate kinase [Bacillota bacterium]